MPPTRIRRRVRRSPPVVLPERLRPRKSPRQQRAQTLVSAILEAGSRVLVDRGYERLSMQEVARIAGVSPGSLYQYFPDKASLVAALVEEQSKRELSFHLARFKTLTPDASFDETIAAVVRSVIAFQRQEGELMRRTLAAMPFLGRYPALSARARDAAGFVRQLLELHQTTLRLSDLDLATHVLANTMHSLTHDGVLARPESLDDETLEREVLHVVHGYLARARRP